ncbi:hypothetical protein B0G52_102330 [Cohnella sp. SGD-V74]|nr:hypothetical protein B0G52_102330 [Cohnella sp. SGD-V74]
MCSVIATGIVQLLALRFSGQTPALFFRYLRTPSKSIVSEATVTVYLRKSIFRLFAQNPHGVCFIGCLCTIYAPPLLILEYFFLLE